MKQGYSSSIYSYISAWGGGTAEGASQQRKAAEAAVEAVTQAEVDNEPLTTETDLDESQIDFSDMINNDLGEFKLTELE